MKIVAIALLAAILAGCGIGPITTTTQEATQGQQLLDLKKAYDKVFFLTRNISESALRSSVIDAQVTFSAS